jgi:uncharacterized protein (TIGR03067 family)
MRLLALGVGAVCVLLVGPGAWVAARAPAPPDKDELKKLEGTWEIVSYEKDGLKIPDELLKELPRVTFKGNTYTWSDDNRPGKIAKIDPTKKPKTIDYEVTGGDDKGQIELGIYTLEGDTFMDCFAPHGKDRPTEFSAKEGSGQTLIKYKRVK